jgi:hypothetical protein
MMGAAWFKSRVFLDLVEYGSQLLRIDRCRGFDDDMDFFLAVVVLRGEQTDAADAKEVTQAILDGRRVPIGSGDGQIAGVKEAVIEEFSRRRFAMEGFVMEERVTRTPARRRRHTATPPGTRSYRR